MSSNWQTTEEAAIARRLMRSVDSGILSTMSKELPGYPFGSVTPYFLTHDGRVVIYVSGIAQHTKNILADPKVCMTVMDSGDESQQSLGRVTVIGDAEIASDDESKVMERYFQFFPEAVRYAQTHSFMFVTIKPKRVRYIGGFGKIFWVEAEDWITPACEWAASEAGVISHMNADHADALALIAKHFCSQASADKAQFVAVDPEGFHLSTTGRTFYVPFENPCLDSKELREALVAMTRTAREA